MSTPDLQDAAVAVDVAGNVVTAAVSRLAAAGDLEANQVVAYDVGHAAAAVEMARAVLDYGAKGDVEAGIATAFVGDAVADRAAKVLGREAGWGVEPGALDAALPFVRQARDAGFLAGLAGKD